MASDSCGNFSISVIVFFRKIQDLPCSETGAVSSNQHEASRNVTQRYHREQMVE